MDGISDKLAAAFGIAGTDDLLEASLDDWIGAQVPTAPGGPDQPERVLPAPDEDTADRLLRRSKRLDAEEERINELAERRIAEIEAWRADATAGLEPERERIHDSLELFMREWRRANPKRKTLTLPNGTLKTRVPSAGRVEVTDEHAFTAWAKRNGRDHLLRYKPEPAASAIREEPQRRTHPDETIEYKGETALHHVWTILVEVPGEHGEVEMAEAPGVRFVQRVGEKFTIDTSGKPSDEEEA